MKKIWLAVGLVVLFVAIDILIRVVWPEGGNDAVSPRKAAVDETAETSPADPKNDMPPAVPGALKNSPGKLKPKARPSEEEIAQRKPKPQTPQSITAEMHTCKKLFDYLKQQRGENLEKEQVSQVWGFTQEWNQENIQGIMHNYMSCRAIEESSLDFCRRAEELLGETYGLVGCYDVYQIIKPVYWFHFKQLDFERFRANIVDAPKDMQEFMIGFYKAMDAKDPNQCLNIAKNPIALAFCNYASGMKFEKSENESINNSYWMVRTLITGEKKYISKIPNDTPVYFIKAAIGERGSCEQLLDKRSEEICNSI